MKVRSAKISDARHIYSLINTYAQQQRMLFRSMADIYENLQSFLVAENDDSVVACCAIDIIWKDLAEIKSLAVHPDQKNKGIGKDLVTYAISRTKQLGIDRVFALTLEPKFFKKLGFEQIPKDQLPMKVWRDCANCPKQDHCDEIAVILNIPR